MPTHTVVSTEEAITRTLTTKHEINMRTRQRLLSLCVCSGAVNNKLHISSCPVCAPPTSLVPHPFLPPTHLHPNHQSTPPLAETRPSLPRGHTYLGLVESISRVGVVQERSLRRLAALRMVGRVLGEGCVWLGLELIICE